MQILFIFLWNLYVKTGYNPNPYLIFLIEPEPKQEP